MSKIRLLCCLTLFLPERVCGTMGQMVVIKIIDYGYNYIIIAIVIESSCTSVIIIVIVISVICVFVTVIGPQIIITYQ